MILCYLALFILSSTRSRRNIYKMNSTTLIFPKYLEDTPNIQIIRGRDPEDFEGVRSTVYNIRVGVRRCGG